MLNRLSQLFATIGFNIEAKNDKLVGPFSINDQRAHLVVRVLGAGEATILNFEVVGLLSPEAVRASDHIGAFVQYLLAQNWRFGAGSVELDTDGEVRVLVELPLADGEVTANQLRLILQILGRNGVELLSKGQHVLKTGQEPSGQEEAASSDGDADLVELLGRFRRMAQTAAGRAALSELKAKDDCPPMVRIMVDAALQQAIPDEL